MSSYIKMQTQLLTQPLTFKTWGLYIWISWIMSLPTLTLMPRAVFFKRTGKQTD